MMRGLEPNRRPGETYCRRCRQRIHRPAMGPWNLPAKDGEPAFYSEWATDFGFPWCPGTNADIAHQSEEVQS